MIFDILWLELHVIYKGPGNTNYGKIRQHYTMIFRPTWDAESDPVLNTNVLLILIKTMVILGLRDGSEVRDTGTDCFSICVRSGGLFCVAGKTLHT